MRGYGRGLVWVLGIVSAICVLLYLFVFDVWVVPEGDPGLAASVRPTLMPLDKVLVLRRSSPIWGELARCTSPDNPSTFVVGRVFGTNGDHVEVSDSVIVTNGKGLASRHGCPEQVITHPVTENLVTLTCGVAETAAWSFEFLTSRETSGGTHTATVEADKLYLVSDNRVMHQDSRDFGQIDAASCQHIVFRLWGEHWMDSSRRMNILW